MSAEETEENVLIAIDDMVVEPGAEGAECDIADVNPAAPTPEEAFLLQVLSSQDIDELRAEEFARQQAQAEEDELSPEEREAKAEHDALSAAFGMVRSRSNAGKLTTPGTWTAEGLVPDHLIPVDFCDIAFDTIIAAQAESVERAKAAEEARQQIEAAKTETEVGAESVGVGIDDALDDSCNNEAPESVARPAAADSEESFDVDTIAFDVESEWQLDDIKVLEGKQTYLYSSDYMTDVYAHWAFLAEEGDDALTLADNARAESRIYPRPMLASSLSNKPYFWDGEQIQSAWQTVQESGEYPDIKTCKASNGDDYFYSTDYLSDAQAKALAEWYSVERYMNV